MPVWYSSLRIRVADMPVWYSSTASAMAPHYFPNGLIEPDLTGLYNSVPCAGTGAVTGNTDT